LELLAGAGLEMRIGSALDIQSGGLSATVLVSWIDHEFTR
jgi:hypothetical protein